MRARKASDKKLIKLAGAATRFPMPEELQNIDFEAMMELVVKAAKEAVEQNRRGFQTNHHIAIAKRPDQGNILRRNKR